MATYSRSQTTTQTTQTSTAMPSMDISSLLVKTMENVMNDSEDKDDSDVQTDLSDVITKAINNSDLLKDKTKNDNDKGLNDLLKDKGSTEKELSDLLKNKKVGDKELSDLLKNVNKDSKDKKKTTVKSNSDKAAGTFGKIVSGGIIASTIKGVMGSSKGLIGGVKGAASGALTGTGKVAGGLVSGVGNIGGSAIAGIGKLFGPVGAIVGKFVGTAVATPFKVVGGTITAAIGGLGKLMNMPLKELVTKGTLIVGVLSQLFVFLEGLMAKFIAQKDVKWVDFMSKLKASISMIPDKLMLSLEKLLSKVKIMGHPLFGGLNKEEKKEYETLQKNKDVVDYGNLVEVDIPEKQKKLEKLQKEMQLSYQHATGGELDFSKYNLNTTAGKEALKNDWLSQLPENERTAMAETIDSQLSDYSYMSGSIDDAQKRANYLANNDSNVKRFLELKEQNESGRSQKYFDEKEKELEEKQQQRQQEYFSQGLYDLSQKQVKDKNGNIVTRGLTQYEQDYAESLHAGSVATVKDMYAAKNETLTTKDPTGAERFLKNQYKEWTDAWSKMFKDLKQDIGINITQKQDIPNPTYYRQ